MRRFYFTFIMILFVFPLFAQTSTENNIEVSIKINAQKDNFWGTMPEIEITTENKTSGVIGDLVYTFNVIDGFGKNLMTKQVECGEIEGGKSHKETVVFDVPYGWFKVEWTLSGSEGTLKKDVFSFTHMSEKCGEGLSPALEKYLMRTCPWGGVFWQCTPEDGRAAGARWLRDFAALWWYTEQEKDKVDIDLIRNDILKYKNKGIESLLMVSMSNHPPFRRPALPSFATDYGNYMGILARECNDIIHYYEFGNEDNGSDKFIYTERCRNFIAGVRKYDNTALLANSGTAFVDVSWFEQQDQRRLLDGLDILITHPYTVTSAPEDWGVYPQGQTMIDFIDKIGGFKELWSTEFGYTIHNDGYSISDTARAEYLVRHFLIQVAAGYTRPGLFAWDGYYGIYENGKATGSVAAIHNMAKILEGYRYAGFLIYPSPRLSATQKSTPQTYGLGGQVGKPWVVCYERLGDNPVVIAWDADGESEYIINHTKVVDVYGNPVETDGKKVTLSHSPLFIFGGDRELIGKAYGDSLCRELERANLQCTMHFKNQKSEIRNQNDFATQNRGTHVDKPESKNQKGDDLWKELKNVSDKYIKNPSRELSCTQFRLLNALIIEARMGADINENCEISPEAFIEKVKGELERLKENDLDNPRLRFVLNQFEKLECERLFASDEKSAYEKNLKEAEKILAMWTYKYILQDSELVQNQVWTYLYGYKKDSVELNEKLSFVPGVTTKILGRVNNYAHNHTTAKISLELPQGWKCVPESITLDLKPGKHEPIAFEITPTSSLEKYHEIITKTEIEGKPVNRTVLNEIEVLSPVILSQIPMDGLITDTPMRFNLKNVDEVPHGGDVVIHFAKDNSVIGKYHFDKIESEETLVAEIKAEGNLENINDWDMYAEIKLDNGVASRSDFSCDFSVATKAKSPVIVDGDLSEWADAYPLNLNKIDYTNGTFGSNWSPEDLSGTVYFKWDEENFYMACVVKDQTFNQCLAGDSTWNQDSMQLAIVPKGRGQAFYELGLALTPNGPETYMHNYAIPEHGGLRTDIPLAVKVSQGQIVYEVAIPWAKYEEEMGKPEVGKEYYYDVLLNDDDVVVPRRYMERFSISIVHERRNVGMGEFKLIEK